MALISTFAAKQNFVRRRPGKTIKSFSGKFDIDTIWIHYISVFDKFP
jgi:hypothetical protein